MYSNIYENPPIILVALSTDKLWSKHYPQPTFGGSYYYKPIQK